MSSTNRVPDVGEFMITLPHARDRRGDNGLPVESEDGLSGRRESPIVRRPSPPKRRQSR